MAQTDPNSYGYALDVAQAGQLGDIGPHRIDTKASEGVTGFGKAVKRGTDPQKQAEVIDNTADTFYGVAVFTHATEQGFDRATSPASTGAEYKDGDAMSVLREGRVYVIGEGEIVAGNPAYVNPVTGDFTAAEDDGGGTPVANVGPVGEFQTGVADGGIVEVDIVRGV